VRRTPTVHPCASYVLAAVLATVSLPLSGPVQARDTVHLATVDATATAAPSIVSPSATAAVTAAVTGTVISIATGTPGTATPAVTGTLPATGTVQATPSPRATATATATATFTARARATTPHPTPTPPPTATSRPTATPRPTPNLHPGYGSVPWARGEYYVWTITGRDIVNGTAYQLFTRSGHQWIDSSAYTLMEQRRYALLPSATIFTGRTAFDANTYKLRRYDGVGALRSDDPDTTGVSSVLRATLFGPHLDYTSYQSWRHPGRAGCTVARGRRAPENTMAYGMMADLLRTITPRATGPVGYTIFDPYSREPAVAASYLVLGRETLSTILGKIPTTHVRFREGSQASLDLWYATSPGHIVVKWGLPGRFGATLAHYEKSSDRTSPPVSPPAVALPKGSVACA